jgi:DNA-binding CsgD family transcriptional regulator
MHRSPMVTRHSPVKFIGETTARHAQFPFWLCCKTFALTSPRDSRGVAWIRCLRAYSYILLWIADRDMERVRHIRAPVGGCLKVTRRESQVLGWIAAGKSDWAIGRILNISGKTVNFHVENAKRKFGVGTRVQAVIAAMREGVISR